MKKYVCLFILICLTIFSGAQACNTCGCGVANYHYGILPQYQKNFIGFRYRHRSYVSQLEEAHQSPYAYETFQSTELWARFYPTKRLQVFAFLPYNFNERKEGEKITYLEGIGDAVVSVNYNMINTYANDSTNWKHNLLIGGGLKLPTGEFRKIDNGVTVNQNFQLGTGSVDFLFNFIYTIRYKNMGLNSEFTFNYNTTNRDEYRFGNTTRSSITAFIIPKTGKITIMPNAGVNVETFRGNEQFNQPLPDTGGWAMLYNAGLESYYKNVAVGVSYAHPGTQQLFHGKVTANDRVSLHVTFLF